MGAFFVQDEDGTPFYGKIDPISGRLWYFKKLDEMDKYEVDVEHLEKNYYPYVEGKNEVD